MRVSQLIKLCAVCLLALSLSSCGGGGAGTPSLAGSVIDGKVSGATLTLYSDQTLATQVGSGSTDSTGAFRISLTVSAAPDPIYIKSVGGTDLDTGLPAPTMVFVGNTAGTNGLATFNVTPLTDNVYRRLRDGSSSTLSSAQSAAQSAFGLSSNTGTDGLYEDPTASGNSGLKTAEFKQLTSGTMGGTITAGNYIMYAITVGDTDTSSATTISSIADITNTANGHFVTASISVDSSGNISGSSGSDYFTGKVVGSSMMFNISDSTSSPTHVTRVVGNIGLNGSVAGDYSDITSLTSTPVMHKGVFVGTLIPSSGVNATNLNTFIQNFYTPGTSSGNMDILARSIFDKNNGVPQFHWGQSAVTAIDASAGSVTMSNMVMEADAGSIVQKSSGTTPQTYTFVFSSGQYVLSGGKPTNLLILQYQMSGGPTLYIATAIGLRRGIYIVVPNGSTTVQSIGEEYMSKVNSVAPNPFTANASTSKSYDVTVSSINPGMPGVLRTTALTYGITPQTAGPVTIPANTDTKNGYIDSSVVSGFSQLMVFQGSMLGLKQDANNDFADNTLSGGTTEDFMRLVEFYDSGAMQGEDIEGGTMTVGGATATLRDYPSTFVGFVQDTSSSVTPSFTGTLNFLARSIYSNDYSSFLHAYVSGSLNITTAPTTSATGAATLTYTPGGGSSSTVTLTVDKLSSGQPGVYHVEGSLAGSDGYIDLVWPIGGTKSVYMVSASSTGTVYEVGEAYLTQ